LTNCLRFAIIAPLIYLSLISTISSKTPLFLNDEEEKGNIYMHIPTLEEMLQAGVHFGHQVSRWHPKMKQYIFGERNGVHIIDLEKTQSQLEDVLAVVEQMTKDGKNILFVSTKPQAKEIVQKAAMHAGMPFLVDRWVGGLLTNFPEIKKLIKKYLTYKEQKESGELERYTKKEQLDIEREMEKMEAMIGGLVELTDLPDAIFLPAFQREKTAFIEANKMHVPIIAVCDTNANPTKADYVIPANDDAVNAIDMIVTLVGDAAKRGVDARAKAQAQAPKAGEAKKVE
jgi:small subunit ribosomal protein S2